MIKRLFKKKQIVHDIREPLQTIIFLSEKAQDKINIDEIKNDLNEISFLVKNIDNVLSKNYEDKIKIEKINLIDILKSLLKYTEYKLNNNASFVYTYTDVFLFRQLIKNILCDCDGKIDVTIYNRYNKVFIEFKYKQEREDEFFYDTNKFIASKLNCDLDIRKENDKKCIIKMEHCIETFLNHTELNVIICEDDYINRLILEENLRKLNIDQIKSFDNGSDCYDYVRRTKNVPDIFLVDLQMPGLTGDELCEKLKSIGIKSKFIAVTGSLITNKIEKELKNKGFSDILQKPYNRESLKLSLIKVLY